MENSNLTEWSKETPTVEGWYWMKYTHKDIYVCPAEVELFLDGTILVRSARGDYFVEGPHHGGKGLKYNGKRDESIRFGPSIPFPDLQKLD
jgi:hypothetical protein